MDDQVSAPVERNRRNSNVAAIMEVARTTNPLRRTSYARPSGGGGNAARGGGNLGQRKRKARGLHHHEGPQGQKGNLTPLYQQEEGLTPATWLFGHVFGEASGWLVAFSGRQARLDDPDARQNELSRVRQRSFRYPDDASSAAGYLVREAARERDAYFGTHLFRESGSRLRTNATGAMSCLWLDEDVGRYPESGPEPTAIVWSSGYRRHLYWALARPLSAEWVVSVNPGASRLGPAEMLARPGSQAS